MTRSWEKIFFLLSFIAMGSSYISPFAYGIMHRLHHMHTDEPEDPHSPVNHPGFFATMFATRNNYLQIYLGNTVVDDKLKKDLPQWEAFDKIAHNWLTRILWIALYTAFYIYFATAAWQYLLLPLTITMGTLHGAAVNWWAHKFGYINYDMPNTSRNIMRLDIFFLGEAYHNNHHKFPGNANYSRRWFEVDSVYIIARLLHSCRVIHFKRSSVVQ